MKASDERLVTGKPMTIRSMRLENRGAAEEKSAADLRI
jgi:hypothetical protein